MMHMSGAAIKMIKSLSLTIINFRTSLTNTSGTHIIMCNYIVPGCQTKYMR